MRNSSCCCFHSFNTIQLCVREDFGVLTREDPADVRNSRQKSWHSLTQTLTPNLKSHMLRQQLRHLTSRELLALCGPSWQNSHEAHRKPLGHPNDALDMAMDRKPFGKMFTKFRKCISFICDEMDGVEQFLSLHHAECFYKASLRNTCERQPPLYFGFAPHLAIC